VRANGLVLTGSLLLGGVGVGFWVCGARVDGTPMNRMVIIAAPTAAIILRLSFFLADEYTRIRLIGAFIGLG
jgi:hypothetical protein